MMFPAINMKECGYKPVPGWRCLCWQWWNKCFCSIANTSCWCLLRLTASAVQLSRAEYCGQEDGLCAGADTSCRSTDRLLLIALRWPSCLTLPERSGAPQCSNTRRFLIIAIPLPAWLSPMAVEPLAKLSKSEMQLVTIKSFCKLKAILSC